MANDKLYALFEGGTYDLPVCTCMCGSAPMVCGQWQWCYGSFLSYYYNMTRFVGFTVHIFLKLKPLKFLKTICSMLFACYSCMYNIYIYNTH